MIASLVKRFYANRDTLREIFASSYPDGYGDIVAKTVALIAGTEYSDDNDGLDSTRITAIDHGDSQGTILYVIAAKGYQPSTFWTVAVGYGSCSVCDTFQAIRDNDSRDYDSRDKPTAQQVDSYMSLALHIIQSIKEVS